MKNRILRCIKKVATLPLIFDFLYKRHGQVVPVLMYHGVCEHDQITPAILDRQFSWISNHFNCYFASEMDMAQRDPRGIILTFDDGLRNNLDIVFPLLSKHQLRATFYVVSGLLSGSDMLWNHEMSARLSQLTCDERRHNFGESAKVIRSYVSGLKERSTDEALSVLKKLRGLTSIEKYTEEHIVRYQIMSAEDLLDMAPDVVEIGAHTHTHPILNQLSLEEAVEEITTSKSVLETLLDRPVHSFCYPNGDFDPELVPIVRENFKTAVTTESGLCYEESCQRAEIPRLFALPNFTDYKFNLLKPMRNR